MWQNHELLEIVNAPLAHQTQKQVSAGEGPLGATYTVQQNARDVASQLAIVVAALERPDSGASAATRASIQSVAPHLRRDIAKLSAAPSGDKPVTLGIGEPFNTTIGVALMFALILALPVILYELYGFLLPAFSPEQRKIAAPLMLAIPVLFAIGVTLRLLRRAASGGALLPELQQRPVQRARAGQPVLPLRRRRIARDGPHLPGTCRRAGCDPGRHRDARRNCATTAATRSSRARWWPPSSLATRSR